MTQPTQRITKAGQRYDFLGFEPVVRRDGKTIRVRRWLTHCATCAMAFELTTPMRIGRWLTRRCPRHRRPGFTVARERRARAEKWMVG